MTTITVTTAQTLHAVLHRDQYQNAIRQP